LDVCRIHNVEFETEPQVGEQLSVPPEYFNSAFETIFEVGIKLAHVLWRKVQPNDLEKADANLRRISYNLLSEERFKLACTVLDFSAITLKPFVSSDQARLMFVINQAQAYKWSGDMESAREILSGEDWSTRSEAFQLAEAVLLDDFERAHKVVKRIGSTGSVEKSDYREWPLFREYRKSEKFQKIFEEVFQEPLNLFSIKPQETENLSEDELPPIDELPSIGELPSIDELPPMDEQLREDKQFLEDELPPIDEQ